MKYEGNPVIFADKPWEQGPGPYWNPATQKVLQIRSAPCWDPDEKVWKLWYFTAHKTAYARSRDGLEWEKPILGKREYEGSTANNLVVVQGDPEAFIQHALLDPDAAPERRYKGLIGTSDRKPVISADGYVFTKFGCPPHTESGRVPSDIRRGEAAVHRHRQTPGTLRSLSLSFAKHGFREMDGSRIDLGAALLERTIILY